MINRKNLTLIPWESHEEWLGIRKKYIGGSDAGAIVGLNPYASAWSVWAEKTGAAPAFEGNLSTRTGTLLEDFVAHLFMEETGKKIQRCNFTIVNGKYPWACANIDREVVSENAIVEIKTTNSYVNLKKFRQGEYPEQWYAQVTHYLAVTGADKAYLAVLSECRDFRIFELERDEEEIAALMEAEKAFWTGYVVTGKVPPADGHMATTEAVKAVWGQENGQSVDLSGMDNLFTQRKALGEQQKALKAAMDEIDNSIKLRMENASTGLCGSWSVSWKTQRTSGLDRDAIRADYPGFDFSKYATSSRVFRVTEKKARA